MTKHLFGCVIERAAFRSAARKSAQLIAIEENATFLRTVMIGITPAEQSFHFLLDRSRTRAFGMRRPGGFVIPIMFFVVRLQEPKIGSIG